MDISTVLAPILVILATQGIKRFSAIPINKGQAGKLMTVAGVLSFVASLLLAAGKGELQSFLSPEMIDVGVNTVLTFVLAQLGY